MDCNLKSEVRLIKTAVGGCYYPPLNTTISKSQYCYMNCDPCSQVTCPKASNDCHLAGSCQSNGRCSDEIVLADGFPCNSQLFGICPIMGVCQSPNTLFSSTVPSVRSSTGPVAPSNSSLPTHQSSSRTIDTIDFFLPTNLHFSFHFKTELESFNNTNSRRLPCFLRIAW